MVRNLSPSRALTLALLTALVAACRAVDGHPERQREDLPRAVRDALAASEAPSPGGGEVFLAFLAPATGRSYAHRGDEVVHAASTMKVPVLIALHRAAQLGELTLDDALPVRNEFRSIVDGSPYSLSPDDDSDVELYAKVGATLPLDELARRMIVRSSNLATNLLVARLGAQNIQRTIEALGARHMRVLRGVEDNKAFERGLSNTATANDLAELMAAIVGGEAVSPEHSRAMLDVLAGQEFNELIPAGLPPGVRVAHKTGSITGILHDAAVVMPEGEPPYVLVVLTRGFAAPDDAGAAIRRVTAAVHASRTSP